MDYSGMTVTELERELERLLDLLDETEATRHFVLRQTGHHVPGVYVKRFEHEINEVNASTTAFKEAIAAMNELPPPQSGGGIG